MEKLKGPLEIVVVSSILLSAFGPILGLEANLYRPTQTQVVDVSYSTYLVQMKEHHGDNLKADILAAWTYLGARLGATIHNWLIEDSHQY